MYQQLTSSRSLWLAFTATVIITASFALIAHQTGLVFLDGVSDPGEARDLIKQWTTEQRQLHAWITGTLDVLYPIAYGALFVGSALRFYGRLGPWLALPLAAVVVVDLLEGVVQVLALLGISDLLAAKSALTPAKFMGVRLGLLVVVGGWVLWLLARIRAARAGD